MSLDNKNPLCTSLNCGKCNSCSPGTPWLMDSGTSKHFTMKMDDFSSYKSIPASNKNKVITTNGKTIIEGKGTVFIQHNVERNSVGPSSESHTCLPFISSQDYLLK